MCGTLNPLRLRDRCRVSYSAHRRDALDPEMPLPHRVSHARSCAMLMGQKYRVHRDAVIEAVRRACGVDLTAPATEAEIVAAVGALDSIKAHGLGDPEPA